MFCPCGDCGESITTQPEDPDDRAAPVREQLRAIRNALSKLPLAGSAAAQKVVLKEEYRLLKSSLAELEFAAENPCQLCAETG